MAKDADTRKIPHTGRGRKVAILVGAAFVVGALIWVVGSRFRGRDIKGNAAAMTAPLPDGSSAPLHP